MDRFSSSTYTFPVSQDDISEQFLIIWGQIREPLIVPLLKIAVFLCLVMSVMLFVERVYMAVVITLVKFFGRKPEKRYKWEPMKDDLELGNSAYPMVLVQIPMYNEKEVYQLSIGAACGLSWPSDRIIIQVLDDSTDPSTFKAYRYQQHRWSCGPANLFRKMFAEIIRNKKVSTWKKVHVIYSFFFIRKIVAHIVTFIFYCVVLPATVLVPEVVIPKWGAVYIPCIITLLNAVGTPRSLHLLVFWILFENVMSLHRTKATFIGLLEAGRVNEWIVTEKLGDALKLKSAPKAFKKPRFKIGERIHLLELATGCYLFFCGCYDIAFGRNHYYIYLYIQAIAFFIVGFGYIGTIVPSLV